MKIETKRLTIAKFTMDMAEAVHKESLDEDNRRFVPDEVFETVEEAAETVEFLMGVYENGNGPLVYPVTLKDGTYIGYVQCSSCFRNFSCKCLSACDYEENRHYRNDGHMPCREPFIRQGYGALRICKALRRNR